MSRWMRSCRGRWRRGQEPLLIIGAIGGGRAQCALFASLICDQGARLGRTGPEVAALLGNPIATNIQVLTDAGKGGAIDQVAIAGHIKVTADRL